MKSSTQRQSNQETIAQLWQQAKDLQAEGKSEAALEVYRSILELDDRHLPSLHQVAQICEKLGMFDEAIEVYRRAIEVDDEPPFWVYRHFGFSLSQKGELDGAVEAYQKAIELQPEDVATYNLLGQAQGKHEDFEGAIAAYQKAIELQPEQPSWVYLNLGEALSEIGRNEEAISAYEKALALEPENPGIRRLLEGVVARKEASEVDRTELARQLQQQGKLDEALAEYRAVLAQDENNLAALHQVAKICESQGKWDEAVEGYRKAVEVDEEPPFWIYRHLGFALSQQGDLEGSIEVYERAVALNPEDGAAQSLLGQVLEKNGDLEGAVEAYQRAIELNPESPAWVYQNLGSTLTKQSQVDEENAKQYKSNQAESIGRKVEGKTFQELVKEGNQHVDSKNWEDAIFYYKKAINLDRKQGEFWLYLNLGKSLLNSSNNQEALIYLRHAFEENSENLEVLSLLGISLIKCKRWKEAEKIYKLILEKEVGNFLVYYDFANSLFGQKKYVKAIENYKKSILLNPNYALAYLHLGDTLFANQQWDEAIDIYEQALQLDPNNETLIVKLNRTKRKATFRPQITNFQVLYVIGEGSISAYYRVEHQVEILKQQGYRVSTINANNLQTTQWNKLYASVIVIFRSLFSEVLENFVKHYKSRGSIIVFDIDDYVFELKIANKNYVDGIRMLDPAQQKLYPKWIESVRKAINLCEYGITSTKFLAQKFNELGKEAFTIENGFDSKMIELAAKVELKNKEKLLHNPAKKIADRQILRIGYGSGTLTHQKDFKSVSTSLSKLLAKHPELVLTIVGLFDITEFPELDEFKTRIEVRELVPHDKLLDEVSRFDINLAPLEVGNPYCDAKSELKYIQAGILSIPTVASPTQTYSEAIEDGKNGFLASNPNEWFQKLNKLVTSSELRKKIGNQAKSDVITRYYEQKKEVVCSVFDFFLKESLEKSSAQFDSALAYTLKYRSSTIQGSPIDLNSKPLLINWIFPDFSSGSGGVSTALRIVKNLIEIGHVNHIWIHNPDLSKTPEDYCQLIQNQYHGVEVRVDFVPKDLDLIYGDAVIATDFLSSLVAKAVSKVNRRFYFVQDHEAEFNPTSYRSYLAKGSYSRDFIALSCGAWLHHLMTDVYGLESVQWELASDPDYYSMPSQNHQRSGNRIAFYCQESKPRRITDLGFLAFEILSRRKIDFHVDFFGEREFFRALPYSYFHHGLLSHNELSELYQTATIGLVFSGTNYSIIPREMMACGLPVVEISSPSSTLSLVNSGSILVSADPYELADRLEELLTNPSLRERVSVQGLKHTSQYSWVKSAKIVEEALIKYCKL